MNKKKKIKLLKKGALLNDLPKYFIRQSSTYYIGTNRDVIK